MKRDHVFQPLPQKTYQALPVEDRRADKAAGRRRDIEEDRTASQDPPCQAVIPCQE